MSIRVAVNKRVFSYGILFLAAVVGGVVLLYPSQVFPLVCNWGGQTMPGCTISVDAKCGPNGCSASSGKTCRGLVVGPLSNCEDEPTGGGGKCPGTKCYRNANGCWTCTTCTWDSAQGKCICPTQKGGPTGSNCESCGGVGEDPCF